MKYVAKYYFRCYDCGLELSPTTHADLMDMVSSDTHMSHRVDYSVHDVPTPVGPTLTGGGREDNKMEYDVIFNARDSGSPVRLSKWLDSMFDEGWALVAVTGDWYFFKRRRAQVAIVGSDVGQSACVSDIIAAQPGKLPRPVPTGE